jgi:hypothetical protein
VRSKDSLDLLKEIYNAPEDEKKLIKRIRCKGKENIWFI